jgi:hypothetical protein
MVLFKTYAKEMLSMVSVYLQRTKSIFNKLATAVDKSLSLEDFNFYIFHGLRGGFGDLVISLSTKTEPFSYSDLHSHLFTHEFLHQYSLQPSLGPSTITPFFSTPSQPFSLAYVAKCQSSFSSSSHGHSFGSFGSNDGRHHRGRWRNNCGMFFLDHVCFTEFIF